VRKRARVKIWKATELPPDWFTRQGTGRKTSRQIEDKVEAVVSEVKRNGDSALLGFTEKFDKAKLDRQNLRVKQKEIDEAYTKVSEKQVSAIRFMKDRVRAFEKRNFYRGKVEFSENGVTVQNVLRPITSVGCYVPGGQAAYPSTLVMTVVPAKVAGVQRIVVCTPPDPIGKVNPIVLVAADICGVDEIYKIGGAQAIAALAYGTETIRPVKKIVGPGNKYVTLAKIFVSKDVAIDMPAGPSEILVLADETADPQFIVLDMISQAEHGTDSVAGLITTAENLAREVQAGLEKKLNSLHRSEIVETSLERNAFMVICPDLNSAVELANIFAPEHIEIMTRNPDQIMARITSAGLILLGSYSPVALSDYCSGTNHVLPTGGAGHAFSGLSASDFSRRVSIVEGSKEGLLSVKDQVNTMAEAENLPNHYKAVEGRFEK
jgi:histidinol dehydrogenase